MSSARQEDPAGNSKRVAAIGSNEPVTKSSVTVVDNAVRASPKPRGSRKVNPKRRSEARRLNDPSYPPAVPTVSVSQTTNEKVTQRVRGGQSHEETGQRLVRSNRPSHGRGRAGSGNLAERIKTELRTGYECMVCMVHIKPSQPVWSCRTCYRLFHLNCTHQWIHRSCPNRRPNEDFEWRCPGCQYTHIESELPKYKCFCGRTENPPFSRHAPFGCGEPCSRARADCSHPCILQCHPGACPPCTVRLPRSSCFCGLDHLDGSMVKCGDVKAVPYSCGRVCEKILNCGLHRCREKCHTSCGRCTAVTGTVSCECGSESRDIVCGEPISSFTCGKSSVVQMDCGIHSFERVCGDSNRDCPKSPKLWGPLCACKQTAIEVDERKTCVDPIPVCDKILLKTLSCGHSIETKCSQSSEDLICTVPVAQYCRCSKTKRTVACNEASVSEFLCNQPCRTWKTCTKCKCAMVCCPDLGRRDYGAESHICFTICGKTLDCGIHRCDEIHHLGNCGKCRVIVREPLSCNCGKTVVQPPFDCGTSRPPCREICNKLLPCGHRDLSLCHSDPNCAPCTILVSKPCAGGHQTLHQIPCYAGNVSCNLKCGKMLSCGKHSDKTLCHSGSCQPCSQQCSSPLQYCEHVCQRECNHEGPECSEERCRARVLATCKCGLRTEETQCGACSGNPDPVRSVLDCSSECFMAQRLAALRQAFKPTEKQEEDLEQYSGELVDLAEKHDKFVRLLDASLIDAVQARTRSLHLPPTDQIKRYMTLEYCQIHYRFETETVKEGDGLHVSIHFVPGETRLPTPTLSQMLDMTPSQALQYTVDFAEDGPKIHLFDVARGYGRITIERINKELKPYVGSYRTRRGEKFDVFLDFFDPNKAVACYRKLKSVSGLEQCRLINVALLVNQEAVPLPIESNNS